MKRQTQRHAAPQIAGWIVLDDGQRIAIRSRTVFGELEHRKQLIGELRKALTQSVTETATQELRAQGAEGQRDAIAGELTRLRATRWVRLGDWCAEARWRWMRLASGRVREVAA